MAATLNNLGAIAQQVGDYATAKKLYDRAVKIYRDIEDRYGQALTLTNLGIVADIQGDTPEAIRLYQAGLELRREIGERLGMAYSFNNLGHVAYAQGDYVKAQRLFQQGLDLRLERGERRLLATSHLSLGLVAIELGQYAEAEEQLQAALRSAAAMQIVPQVLEILSGVAALWLRTDRTDSTLLQEVFTLVIEHSATPQEVREKAQHLQAEWLIHQPTPSKTSLQTRSWQEIVAEVLSADQQQV